MLTFALVGNPNTGKTTLFNELTNSNYQVGNRSGVTVESKEGLCVYSKAQIKIVDLPGIYSLFPNSEDETATYSYIVNEKPDLILNIVDATNLERNLYLSICLAKMNIPIVIALSMTDVLDENGIFIDIERLSELLKIKIIPVSANKKTGIRELVEGTVDAVAETNKTEKYKELSDSLQYYEFIRGVIKQCVIKKGINKQSERTEKIDRILTHKIWGLPIFFLVMLIVLQLTFGSFGAWLSEQAYNFFNILLVKPIGDFLNTIGASLFLKRLMIEGIASGLGGVLAFFPQLLILFLFLSLLEDTGYMARAAFITDRLFVKLGLSGKTFIPMLLGFGCTASAAPAVRTLESRRNKILTLFLLPFMSCGAKMPIYALFTSALFPNCGGAVIFGIYLFGIVLGLAWCVVLSKTVFKGEPQPLALEMPPYRIPSLKSTARNIRKKAVDFLHRIGTALLAASIFIWLFQNLDFTLHMTDDNSKSILGIMGKYIAPLFIPCGFGDWRAVVGLISGMAAKEAIASAVSILYCSGGAELTMALKNAYTPLQGLSFLVFVLLYIPCVAAVEAIKTELNSKKLTVFFIVCQLVIAWLAAFFVFQIGGLFF